MKNLFFLLVIVIFANVLGFAQQAETPISLERVADDRKFSAGMNFMALNMYDKALAEFNEYLEVHYNGSHRSEAYSKIAGIYFDRQYYLKAIVYYKRLFEEFSNSEEGIAAYYNIGVCYVKMGYDEQAQDVFTKIIREYPVSQQAAKAQVQLDLLKIFK